MATQQTAVEISVIKAFPRRSKAVVVFERIEEAINRRPGVLIVSICAVGFAVTAAQSVNKLMWFDEFITFYIAKLGSLRAIWGALARGADPNPPLSHWLASLSMRAFGVNSFAARLPFMLAGIIGLFALFGFLRRRVPPLYAAAAVLFFMSTAAFDYFFESRSYALTLSFSALSLFFWQEAADGKRPVLSSIGMGLALSAGISSNYFAVLAFFPIAAGELVRNIVRRRLEWRVWIALALAGSTLLLYLPLINGAIARFSPYAWNKVDLDTVFDSYFFMVAHILWLGIALASAGVFATLCVLPSSAARRERSLIVCVWKMVRDTFTARQNKPASFGLPLHEAVAVIVLGLYPFLGYAVASIRGGMFSPRFVLPVCFGVAIIAATSAYRAFGKYSVAGLLFFATVAVWFMAREGEVASDYYNERQAFNHVLQVLPPDHTLLVSDSLLVVPMYYYAPPAIASRMVFPVDFRAIRQYKGEDSPEENLWAGRNKVFPVPIVPLDKVLDQTSNFLVVSTDDNWLLRRLQEDGDKPKELPIFTDSRHIWAFTPLCHGQVWFFRNNSDDELAASQYNSREHESAIQ